MRKTLPIALVISLGLLAFSCADDANDGADAPSATIVLGPDASVRKLSDEEVIDNALAIYFLGVYNADLDILKDAICRDAYSSRAIARMASSLGELPRGQRFGQPESARADVQISDDGQSGVVTADVETVGVRGTVTLHAVRADGGCIDRIEVSDERYVGLLVPILG